MDGRTAYQIRYKYGDGFSDNVLHLGIHRKLDADSDYGYADSACVPILIGDIILGIIPTGLLRRSL